MPILPLNEPNGGGITKPLRPPMKMQPVPTPQAYFARSGEAGNNHMLFGAPPEVSRTSRYAEMALS